MPVRAHGMPGFPANTAHLWEKDVATGVFSSPGQTLFQLHRDPISYSQTGPES